MIRTILKDVSVLHKSDGLQKASAVLPNCRNLRRGKARILRRGVALPLLQQFLHLAFLSEKMRSLSPSVWQNSRRHRIALSVDLSL